MYKKYRDTHGQILVNMIYNIETNSCIPFVHANTDYQQFKKDIMDGGELQDADGAVMTDAQEFVRGLP